MLPRIVTIQIRILLVFLGLCMAVAHAKAAGKKGQNGQSMSLATARPAAKLSTDIHFDGVNVGGRRQVPFEASAVVENEKQTPSLIDFRGDYNDRIARSRTGR